MLRIGTWAILLAIPAVALSDSIKVGEDVHNDVYIDSDDEYYYIRFPEEGRVEKVSRQRQDVSEPIIDTDADLRSRMLKRFESNKAMAEKKAEATATKPTSELTNEAVEESAQIKERALFDAQVEYWKRLSTEDRAVIEDYLISLADTEELNYAIVRKEVTEEIVDLEAQKAAHQARLAHLAQLKEQALAEARRLGRPDLFAQLYNASVYDYEAVPHGQAISALNETIEDTAVVGVAEEAKSVDQRIRVGTFLARLDQLTAAVSEDYESPLKRSVMAAWEGNASQKTEVFAITAPFWRLDCIREDLGESGSFAVTVYDAETGAPFTRISGVDFLQMRVRVLDGPGRYYLEIEQDSSIIPYEIKAVTFSE
jgi:hypothetical protein